MSTLKVNTLQDASGVERFTARAWVNFDGTGTVAIRASGNVSSITDHGAGDYTVNFATALPDANYAALVCHGFGGSTSTKNFYLFGSPTNGVRVAPTTSGFRFGTAQAGTGGTDNADLTAVVFR